MRHSLALPALAAHLLLALACAGDLPWDKTTTTAAPSPAPAPLDLAAAPTLALRDDDVLVAGPADADVVLMQLSDWRCPHCADAWPRALAAVEARPGVALRFRTYPLGGPCNPAVTREDPDRCALAAAALCAADRGAFRAYAEAAFAQMSEPVDAVLAAAALDDPAARACLDDPATLARVSAHAESGQAAGVLGTPTFFVGWRGRFRQLEGADAIPAALDAALAGWPAEAP